MFFLLSKIVGFVALPSNTIVLICVVGVSLLVTRWRRAGIVLSAAGIGLLVLCGYSPLGRLLLLPLTERFPAWQSGGRAPDGIIVLGGAIQPENSMARHTVELNARGERILAMLELARCFPDARIIYSGGSANMMFEPVPEAPIAGDLLKRFDVAPSRIVLEDGSRTTSENARFVRTLIAPAAGQRWLLVTSAFHMPRAIGAFRAAGLDVEAYPVDWQSRGWADARFPFGSPVAGLAVTDTAVREWMGLVGYWLTGRSSALFPRPHRP